VLFSGRRLFAFDMEKSGVTQCNEMTILTNSLVLLHTLLFWLRIEVVDPRFILNNKLWNKFLLGHVRIVREVLQKLVHSSGVSIWTPIWPTLYSYTKMHKILIAQKSYCARRVLSLATIRSKYYFNFILNRTRFRPRTFWSPLVYVAMWFDEQRACRYFANSHCTSVSGCDWEGWLD